MTVSEGNLWTIGELKERVGASLSVDYEGQKNGQVRDVPGTRAIRYYTTLGLLDRPAAMKGRTALYGRRHLAQLVAVKRLQADGLSLTEVQEQLSAVTDTRLEEIAQLPDDMPAAPPRPTERAQPPARRREAFWAAAPAEPSKSTEEEDAPRLLTPVRLGDDLTVLVTAQRVVTEDDLQAIREAAAPLRAVLQQLGLNDPDEGSLT
jgi:DNA-binding transcriptional MerR regulator